MSEETEAERRLSRAEIATYLGRLSAGFDGDDEVRFMVGDDEVAVSPPDECTFDVEYEREDDEEEIEIEVEWSTFESAGRITTPEDGGSAADGDAGESDDAAESDPAADDDDASEGNDVANVGADDGDADGGDADGGDAADAETELPPASTESQATFQLFEDKSGEWRWRLVHRNGNVIATSGEGYTRKANAEKGMRSVKRNAQGALAEIDE